MASGSISRSCARFELIGRPRDSLDAAVKVAKEAGYEVIDLGADLEGEARDVAASHAAMAKKARAEGKRIANIIHPHTIDIHVYHNPIIYTAPKICGPEGRFWCA